MSDPIDVSPPPPARPPIEGHELAHDVAVADLEPRGLPVVLEVLGREPHRRERVDVVVAAEGGVAVDDGVGVDDRARPDLDLGPDHRVGPDAHAGAEARPRVDARGGIDDRRLQGRDLQQELGLRHPMLARAHLAAHATERTPAVQDRDLEPQLVAGHGRTAELRVVDAHEMDLETPGIGRVLEQPDARGLGQALHEEDTRHHRRPREVAFEELLGPGDVLDRDQAAGGIVLEHAVHEDERVLGGNLPDEPRNVDGGRVHGTSHSSGTESRSRQSAG